MRKKGSLLYDYVVVLGKMGVSRPNTYRLVASLDKEGLI